MNIEKVVPLSVQHISQVTDKKNIIIGNVYYRTFEHFHISTEINSVRNCPHYTIDLQGNIRSHYNDAYFNYFVDNGIENAITIGLLNISMLFKQNDKYYDIYKNIYNGEVYVKKWKDCEYWQPYSDIQMDSCIELCNHILKSNEIPRKVISMNTYKSTIENFDGICYRSNYNSKHYDINPNWNFKKFKSTIENERYNKENDKTA